MTFQEAIQALGTMPEQVTNKLREMGIKGYRSSAGRCPVANYLKACGFPEVTVACHAKRYPNEDVRERAAEVVALPDGVKQWIRDFDDGKLSEFDKAYEP